VGSTDLPNGDEAIQAYPAVPANVSKENEGESSKNSKAHDPPRDLMPAVMERETPKVQTTLRVPEPLYREVKELLDQHKIEGASVNDVVVAALQRFVDEIREQMIDAQFAEMATDEKYQAQCRVLAGEFARADWESLPTEDNTARAAR
jgi:hypothetical protein